MADNVIELTDPQGLMIIVPVDKWAEGMRKLITKAMQLGITTNCIVSQKLGDTENPFELSIILWGDK